PAFLYAIPVERFMSLNGARTANLWFLAIVAGWRVVLYVLLLMRYARFEGLRLFVAALLPLTIIVFSLTALNLERAVFDIMRGVDPGHGTAADSAYAVLVLVSILSIYLAPILVFLYFLAIGLVHHRVHE